LNEKKFQNKNLIQKFFGERIILSKTTMTQKKTMEFRVLVTPQQEPNVFDITVEHKAVVPSTRCERLERRKRTKESLHRWTKNSSLPMWMTDLAIDFNPDYPNYYQELIRPELETRRINYGWENLAKFKPQVESLKRFILMNFPGVVSSQVAELVATFEAQEDDLSDKEKIYLRQIKHALEKPKELLQLQRLAKRNPIHRIRKALASCEILKPSYTNIALN